jgi:GxxExxY protein
MSGGVIFRADFFSLPRTPPAENRKMHHRDTEFTEKTKESINGLTERVIGAAMEVHRVLGPGRLESAYEECLAYELSQRGVDFKRQQPLPPTYKGTRLDCGYRLDFIVEQQVVLELKAVEGILPIHEAQLLSYLRLSGMKWGLLFNCHAPVLKHGIRRMAK